MDYCAKLLLISLLFLFHLNKINSYNISFFTFGDSFVDPGNNNFIETRAKANFLPYGKIFYGRKATGRFSNGRLFPDFIAEHLGLREYIPYLSLDDQIVDPFRTAVSFGSATSGYAVKTSMVLKAIPIEDQLKLFQQYMEKLEAKLGNEEAQRVVEKAFFYVNSGSEDFAFGFIGEDGSPTIRVNLDTYVRSLLKLARKFIQNLLNVGARKIAINGLPPLGCVPVAITTVQYNSLEKTPQRRCNKLINNATNFFNKKLQNLIYEMQAGSPLVGTKIEYVNFEKPLLDIIANPNTFGFKEVTKGCCGTGLFEISVFCNNTCAVCADPGKYVFWDAAHPTEKTNKIIFEFNKNAITQLLGEDVIV